MEGEILLTTTQTSATQPSRSKGDVVAMLPPELSAFFDAVLFQVCPVLLPSPCASVGLLRVGFFNHSPELLDNRNARWRLLQKLANELHDEVFLSLAHPHNAPSLFGSSNGLTVALVNFFEPSTASA